MNAVASHHIGLGKVHGRLPAVRHYFSTLIFRNVDGNHVYYELTGKFHYKYPSKKHYKVRWHHVERRVLGAGKAIRSRISTVLGRADIPLLRFQYITTAHLRAGAMRHIALVHVADEDFASLYGTGMLRELAVIEADTIDTADLWSVHEQKIKDVIFAILPISMHLSKVQKVAGKTAQVAA